MVEYQCPHCKTLLKVPERFVGSRGTCRNCRNTITIEVGNVRNGNGNGNGAANTPRPVRTPVLIALHLVVTGPTSRKDSIIEVGALKVGFDGTQQDQFWSFAHPDVPIAPATTERTGITSDMIAAAPSALDVLNDLFAWAGPNAIFFTDHAHLHAKFLCAAYYRENIEPPDGRIVDVCNWAEQLEIRAPEYRLRALLGAIGLSSMPSHRATEMVDGIAQLMAHLLQKEVERMPKQDDARARRALGKRDSSADPRLIDRMHAIAFSFDQTCGPKFHMREVFEERRRQRNGNGHPPAAGMPTPLILHMPEWYIEKKRIIDEALASALPAPNELPALEPEDEKWAQALVEATKSHDPDEQRTLLLRAVSLGARDPWPYERLTGVFIKSKDYLSAQKVCQRYFDLELWKHPRNADSSKRLLERMEKLERRLSGAA